MSTTSGRSRARDLSIVGALAALAVLQTGCLSRRIFVTSEPPGARVWLNDVEIGRTPVAAEFTYFGTYDVRVEREGYETFEGPKEASAPWYEYPVIDLLAIAAPWSIETKINWHFELEEKVGSADRTEVLERGEEMREQVGSDGSP